MPRNSPSTEAVYDRKFRKKVDSRTLITIRKGKMTPLKHKMNPIKMNFQARIEKL